MADNLSQLKAIVYLTLQEMRLSNIVSLTDNKIKEYTIQYDLPIQHDIRQDFFNKYYKLNHLEKAKLLKYIKYILNYVKFYRRYPPPPPPYSTEPHSRARWLTSTTTRSRRSGGKKRKIRRKTYKNKK